MKQMLQLFVFDLKSSMKSFMGGYIIIVPMVILIILSTFLPSVESTSATVAVVAEGANAVEQELIEALDAFADVKKYDTIEDMERKLRGTGSAEGLYWDPKTGQYVSVVERTRESNTVFSAAARVVRQYTYMKDNPAAPTITRYSYGVPEELADRSKTSPVATVGGAIFFTFMVIICGFLIGMSIITDKEMGTIQAIRISPANKADYFIGKSIFPFLVLAVYTIIALLILKLSHVNILQTYVFMIVSYSVTILFGLIMGAIGNNENEAIGYGKLLSMVVMLAILGATLLPDRWHWVVWWSPVYWIYDLLEEIFTESATWGSLLWKSAVTVGISGIFSVLLRKKIAKGLS